MRTAYCIEPSLQLLADLAHKRVIRKGLGEAESARRRVQRAERLDARIVLADAPTAQQSSGSVGAGRGQLEHPLFARHAAYEKIRLSSYRSCGPRRVSAITA